MTYQLVLSRKFEYPAFADDGGDGDAASCGFDAHAQACCDALLVMDPCDRLATLEQLQAQPFFRNVQWDSLWDIPGPRIIPPPAAQDAHTSQPHDEMLPSPALPPSQLSPGEAVVLSANARRKRGASATDGLLVLTTGMRLALLPQGLASVTALLVSTGNVLGRLSSIDSSHLVVRADTGEDAFVELLGSDTDEWIKAVHN